MGHDHFLDDLWSPVQCNCTVCGVPFTASNRRVKYCPTCGPAVHAAQTKAWAAMQKRKPKHKTASRFGFLARQWRKRNPDNPAGRYDVSMADEPEWTEVWKSLTDERLEETLYHYRWLSLNTPNSHASRIDALIQECQRRGLSDIPERVQARRRQAN